VVNPVIELRQLLSNPRYLYGSILAGLVLLIVLASMAIRALRRARAARRGAMAERETSPEEYAESSYTESSFESGEESGPPADGSYEQLRQRINQEADQDPEATAEILRKWISTENGGGGNSQTAGL
jgi:flagellar biosynthesis/type III secretory pathway M-ring protein FliF/YscJ